TWEPKSGEGVAGEGGQHHVGDRVRHAEHQAVRRVAREVPGTHRFEIRVPLRLARNPRRRHREQLVRGLETRAEHPAKRQQQRDRAQAENRVPRNPLNAERGTRNAERNPLNAERRTRNADRHWYATSPRIARKLNSETTRMMPNNTKLIAAA